MRLFVILLALFAAPALAQAQTAASVCFVPGPEDCAGVVAREIGHAQHAIDVQAYGFTEPQIAQALIDAHARGVAVRLISDKTGPSERNGKAVVLAMAGVPVWVDYLPRIAHNKVIVIDGETVLTGSFNWTFSADRRNAENLLVLHDAGLAAAYQANFESRLEASEPLDQYEANRDQ